MKYPGSNGKLTSLPALDPTPVTNAATTTPPTALLLTVVKSLGSHSHQHALSYSSFKKSSPISYPVAPCSCTTSICPPFTTYYSKGIITGISFHSCHLLDPCHVGSCPTTPSKHLSTSPLRSLLSNPITPQFPVPSSLT